MNDSRTTRLNELTEETKLFFSRLAGYDTLRLVLCKKAILVEGDSDELIVQKAYKDTNSGTLPIENGIDVISVGTSFLRFLEIAEKINKSVVVVTDNDGKPDVLKAKYKDYLGENAKDSIKICYDEEVDTGELELDSTKFNYNTLEPKLLKVNSLELLNKVFSKTYVDDDEMHKYMKNNKTECALKIFDSTEEITFPQYISDAIN